MTRSTPAFREPPDLPGEERAPADRHERLRQAAGGVAEALRLAAGEDDRLHQAGAFGARGRSPRIGSPPARIASGSSMLRPSTNTARAHRRRDRPPVDVGELGPLRDEHDRVGVRAAASTTLATCSTPWRPSACATGSQATTSAPSASSRPASTNAGASRVSSVFGLNASPRSAIRFPRSGAEELLQLADDAPLLELVHLDHGVQDLEVVARVGGELLEREGVLGEARAAEAHPRPQEALADPAIVADPLGDLDHVGAGRLADVRDLVDERDPRHQRGVRGELGHLGRRDVRADDRRVDPGVELGDGVARRPRRTRRSRSGRAP